MDNFEREVGAMLDFQHFEVNDRLKALIADFDKSYGNKYVSERITFDELAGKTRETKNTKRPESAERQKTKDFYKE